MLHVFVDESAAFVDARLVQPVSALTQPERRVGLAFPTSSGSGTVRIVRPFLGFAGEPPEAGQSFAFPVPVGVAEHASGSGDGVELFGVAGEDDLGSMEFGEFGDPLQEPGVGHARLVHDDQLVRPDRRRVRDVTGRYPGADEQSFQRVGRVPQLLLESAFLLDLGFDPFGIVEGQEHSDGHAFASDAVFELTHRPGAGRQADDAALTVLGLPCLRDRFHGGGLARACRSDDAADQAWILQRVCGGFLLVGCEWIASLGAHPFVPLVEPLVAFTGLVSDSGGLVETGDHVPFGFEHVDRRVLVEVGVLEHALPLTGGDAQIVQRAWRELVPVGCEFDALAEGLVRDLVRDDDALRRIDAHFA